MAVFAIRTHELSKRYRLGVSGRGYGTLRESISALALRPRRGAPAGAAADESTLWALKDLTVTIDEGEIVGVIGHNGAGKTTLLRILSRITEPTSGWGEVNGRVG